MQFVRTFLCLFLSLFLFAPLASAKKKQAVDHSRISLRFDYGLYKQLDSRKRLKYLKVLSKLAVKLDKAKRYRKSAALQLEEIMFPRAYAAIFKCLNGGVMYKIDANKKTDCNDLENYPVPSSVEVAQFVNCSTGQTRCSLALGLSDDGKAFCYKNSDVKSATSKCKLAAGSQGVKNLKKRLDACVAGRGLECSALIEAIDQDTRNFGPFCDTGVYGATCAGSRSDIADIRRKANLPQASEIEARKRTATGCTEARQKVYMAAFEAIAPADAGTPDPGAAAAVTEGADPRWIYLVQQTGAICGSKRSTQEMFERFGICKTGDATNVGRDMREDARLRSARKSMINGSRASSDGESRFRDYFGISTAEYKSIFCKTGDTKEYHLNLRNKIAKMKKPKAADIHNREVISALLDAPESRKLQALADRVGSVSDATLKGLLQAYITASSEYQSLMQQLEPLRRLCNQTKSAIDCQKVARLNARKSELVRAGASGSAERAAVIKHISVSGYDLKTNMGTGLYKKFYNHASDNWEKMNRSEFSRAAWKMREKFVSCAKQTSEVKPHTVAGGGRDDKYVSNVAGQKCKRDKLSTLDGRSNREGMIYLHNGSRCFVSDGEFVSASHCKTGSAIRLQDPVNDKYEPNVLCTDEAPDKYSLYQFLCDVPTPDPAGYGPTDVQL